MLDIELELDTKEVLNLASSAHQEEEMTTPDGVVFSWL